MTDIAITNIYTDKDFATISARLRLLMQSVKPDWDITNDAGFGNILMDLMSVAIDIANKYNDSNYQEITSTTARFLQTLLNKAYDLDYQMPLQQAALTILTGSLTAIANSIVLPSGTNFSTSGSDPIGFQTISQQIISAGTTSVSIIVENSENKTQTITPTSETYWFK